MADYQAVYEKRFVKNLTRYSSLRQQIRRCVDRVIKDPRQNFLAMSAESLT